MAEGHAVVRWARALRSLEGSPLVRVDAPARWSSRARQLRGHCVTEVGTHGKHLLVATSCDLTVHCHAMIYGSWQFGAPGMTLRKPQRQVRLRLRTVEREAVFFNGPVMELLTPEELAAHGRLTRLGPDVMSDTFDGNEAWCRLFLDAQRETGDAVLDQRIVAGIGNIYKSESLFLTGILPTRMVSSLGRQQVDRLWNMARHLMWRDARRSGPIVTLDDPLRRDGDRHWVYRRRGRPCFRCGTRIEMVRQGELRRATYFCPTCQV